MVELYDLKIVAGMRNDGNRAPTTDLEDHWPIGGIDEHIAQLDFETSSIANEESIFSSIAAMDAALISTDSLDMETLRQRCETKKNDYKLTFEDSGQWTTSGFGTGTSPSGAAIQFDDDLSEEDQKRQSADLLLNNDGDFPNGTFTTWGRIKSVEPPYDPKTSSVPSVAFRPAQSNQTERRPTSLLANFVERQQQTNNTVIPHDYEYSEQYLGEGRYLDLNENEIGYAPANTAPIQQSASTPLKRSLPPIPPTTPLASKDRWHVAHQRAASSNGPPRRTFANLAPNNGAVPEDLNFLSLPFKVPSFCRPSASLDMIFDRAHQADANPNRISASKTEAFLAELLSDNNAGVLPCTTGKLLQSPTLTQLTPPDSGLGSSGPSSISGPCHIQDWESLSILLPKHVVEACSFFKSNVSLLNGGSASTANMSTNNSIERKSRSACRTCYGLRSTCLHPPDIFARSQKELCDCSASTEHSTRKFSSLSVASDRKQTHHRRAKLHTEELSVIGLPIYDAKRQLIERVVEGVAELVRGGSNNLLYSALERLMSDGLKSECTLWTAIVKLTKPGKATNTVYNIVQRLEASEKLNNSRRVQSFFKELLRFELLRLSPLICDLFRMNSLDGYLSYIVMKEKQLAEFYCDTAFLLRAHNAYRSLFWRLIESLELLSVLTQCERPSTSQPELNLPNSPTASRLPADSRIPKSTSEPLRLSVKLDKGSRSLSTTGVFGRRKRSSKIPVLVGLSQHRSRSMKLR
ncbi:RUN domain-containing protein [Aphelenchoides bicaudatus]|nr:RUN domain-containing protein [Aphelenchoides bicaudatus]